MNSPKQEQKLHPNLKFVLSFVSLVLLRRRCRCNYSMTTLPTKRQWVWRCAFLCVCVCSEPRDSSLSLSDRGDSRTHFMPSPPPGAVDILSILKLPWHRQLSTARMASCHVGTHSLTKKNHILSFSFTPLDMSLHSLFRVIFFLLSSLPTFTSLFSHSPSYPAFQCCPLPQCFSWLPAPVTFISPPLLRLLHITASLSLHLSWLRCLEIHSRVSRPLPVFFLSPVNLCC